VLASHCAPAHNIRASVDIAEKNRRRRWLPYWSTAMLAIANQEWIGVPLLTDASFTADQLRQLTWVQATDAAERELVPLDQACVDHQVCRRLAFALWLRVSDRISESDEP